MCFYDYYLIINFYYYHLVDHVMWFITISTWLPVSILTVISWFIIIQMILLMADFQFSVRASVIYILWVYPGLKSISNIKFSELLTITLASYCLEHHLKKQNSELSVISEWNGIIWFTRRHRFWCTASLWVFSPKRKPVRQRLKSRNPFGRRWTTKTTKDWKKQRGGCFNFCV